MSADQPSRGVARRLGGSLVGALALIGGLVLLGVLVVAIGFMLRDRHDEARVAADDTAESVVFRLRNAQPIGGTELIRIDVDASGSDNDPYSSSGRDDLRNIILIDKATGAGRRLLPDNGRRIVEAHFFPAAPSSPAPASADLLVNEADGSRPAVPPAYFVIALEQVGDSRTQDLLVGRLSDGRRAVAMRGIDGLQSVWMQAPHQLVVLVRERLSLYHRILDLNTLRVTSSRKIEVGS